MLRLKSLGQTVIEFDDARVTPAAETVFATGLYLAMEAGRPVGRDELSQMIWPGVPEDKAQHGLRQAIYRLRSFGATIKADRDSLTLPAKYCSVDFAPLLTGVSSASNLEKLVEGIGGSFLPGYRPQLSDEFSAWVERKRDIVHSALLRALVATLETKKGRSDWTAAENIAKLCLTIDPLNEEATLTIAEAAVLGGSKSKAMSILNAYLEDIGPEAGEIRLPAVMLRRRISEAFRDQKEAINDPRFIGRNEELTSLHRAMDRAHSQHGSAHLIRGESGIGKSRLVSEFTRVVALQRVAIVRVRCQSHDVRRPLSAFVELVQQLLALPGALGCSPESMHYLKRLKELEELKTHLTNSDRSDGTFDHISAAIVDLIGALSIEKCLLISIDDSQWLDGYSKLVLTRLAEWSKQNRVLILATYSSVEKSDAVCEWTKAFYDLPLPPLSQESIESLVEQVARARPALSKLFREWCVASSCGNPFFAIHLAAHATDDGSFKSPPSITLLIEARLAALGKLSRRVLQAISILGRNSRLSLVESVLDQSRIELLTSFDELEGNNLVEVCGELINSRHDLISSSSLSKISEASRRLLHRHAARALDDIHPKSATLLWDCAEHWRQAGETAKAVSLMVQCAQYSLQLGLALEAARTFEAAAQIEKGAYRANLLNSSARAFLIAGEWKEAGRLANDSLKASRLTSTDRLAEAEAEFFVVECEIESAAYSEDGKEKLLQLIKDWRIHKHLSCRAALCAMMAADNRRDRAFAESVYTIMLTMLEVSAAEDMHWQHGLLVYHCSFGDHNQALPIYHRLVQHARHTESLNERGRLLDHAGIAAQASGNIDSARSLHREAYELSLENFMYARAESAAQQLASLAINRGDIAEARQWFDAACEQERLSKRKLKSTNLDSLDAELCIREGDFARARSLNEDTRTTAMRVGTIYATARQCSLECHLALASTGAITAIQCQQLEELHPKMIGSLRHDYLVAQLVRGLISLTRVEQAKEVFSRYLQVERKSSAPLSRDLLQLYDGESLASESGR